MYRTWLFIFSTFLALTMGNARELNVSMVTSTSIDKQLPFNIFTPGNWQAETDAEFVKVHIYPDEAVLVSAIEVASCKEPFKERVGLFLNFDQKVFRIKGGTPLLRQELKKPFEVRSITLNFQGNKTPCISEVRVFDETGKKIQLKPPHIDAGQAFATSTLEPKESYDIMNLFDSRFEFAWSSNKKPQGDKLEFHFANTRKVTQIKIWNGYQRSAAHCFSNSRVKTLLLEDDAGFSETITLKDIMGQQTVALKKPFKGKFLKMTIVEAYPGKKYKEVVISEMRFFNGAEWFMLNPLNRVRSIVQKNRSNFKKAGFNDLLNHSLSGQLVSSKKGGPRHGNWTLRLRTDGSFFMEGNNTSTSGDMEKMEEFFALGNYEVKSTKSGNLRLRIFGLLRVYEEEYPLEMDCNGCGRDCNLVENERGEKELIFSDYITLKPLKKKGIRGRYIVKRDAKKRQLNFKTLQMSVE